MEIPNLDYKKILMLCPDKNEYWELETAKQNKNVDLYTLYKPCNKFFRLIRRIFVHLKISIRPFLDSWYKRMDEYDSIIIEANIINSTLPQWLRKNNYKGRIIYWYWNPVISCVKPKKIDRKLCELWSFDPNDCIKYNFKFNSQYYLPTFHVEEGIATKYDVIFIGREKGRLSYLKELKGLMNSIGLNTYFHIVKDDNSVDTEGIYKSLISYEEILRIIGQSRSIIDVVQEGQSGQTLRAMEALFFSKKLITNNKSIIESDFYRKENIFVLGLDDISKLKEFFDIPFHPIETNIIDKYEFNQWINRF